MEGFPEIEPFRRRFEEIDALMVTPGFFNDQRTSVDLSREHQKLSMLLDAHAHLLRLEGEIGEHRSIISDSESDEDLADLAREELPELEKRLDEIRQEALVSMLPSGADDGRNTIVEIRAGAGGDEASLFAADLYRMYTRYAETNGWKVEHLGSSESESGGFKQVVCLISGDDVYRSLKFESGVHRVQRVPVTEASGRIHTSTATVAVLPEAREVDVHIDPAELEISVCRASGPGGQGVNTTDSAVQIVHKPTGITVYCADERSQLKNKNKGLKVLRARLLSVKEEEERAKYAANRRSQIGTGDRSERIRTYNFPQSRLTDHRIGLTVHSLPQVIEGDLSEVLEALQAADRDARLEALLSGEMNGAG
jgi:peptide chain release factor 1